MDADILKEHADGVRAARELYWKKGMSGGRSKSAKAFVDENFADLRALEDRFVREEGHQ